MQKVPLRLVLLETPRLAGDVAPPGGVPVASESGRPRHRGETPAGSGAEPASALGERVQGGAEAGAGEDRPVHIADVVLGPHRLPAISLRPS